jgi:hypothetical protein
MAILRAMCKAAALTVLLSGCAVTDQDLDAASAFAAPGSATRADVIAQLGEPSGSYETDHIQTWPVVLDGDRLTTAAPLALCENPSYRDFANADYCLVVVYDPTGKVERKSVVRLR